MCGRYVVKGPLEVLLARFGAHLSPSLDPSSFPPRYNVAPTQSVPIVVRVEDGRRLGLMRWGLVPSWAESPAVGAKAINARVETVRGKPTFRDALARRRCLVPADGFYEWKAVGGKNRAPMLFRLSNGEPFAFAGLWERFRQDDVTLVTFTILTTSPNELVRSVHDRMPMILRPEMEARWLEPGELSPKDLEEMGRSYPAAEMTVHEVGKAVGSPRNDGPELVLPTSEGAPTGPDRE